MQSMRLHCLGCFISSLPPKQVSGQLRLNLYNLGGAPAELARLHLAAAGFKGRGEGALSTRIEANPDVIHQGNAFPFLGCGLG